MTSHRSRSTTPGQTVHLDVEAESTQPRDSATRPRRAIESSDAKIAVNALQLLRVSQVQDEFVVFDP